MKLIVTVDTEEDNWARYSATQNPVENIKRLVPLQQLFDRYRVRPTYLVSYPVATNLESVATLKGILEQDKCEIGMHCHPWNTPPFEEEITPINSMLCNLPEPLVLEKLKSLHEAIQHNFGVSPVSFRAGRWGFSSKVARGLSQLGYRIDTSVSPFVNWGEYHGPNFSAFPLVPYRFNPDDIATPHTNGSLLEIPATVGFLQNNFECCQRWTQSLETTYGKKLRLVGLASRLHLLNKVWFSPELADTNHMIQLAERVKHMGCPCLNMSFHSTTLMAGLSPFVKNKQDEVNFCKRIEEVLIYAVENKYHTATLSQCLECFTGA